MTQKGRDEPETIDTIVIECNSANHELLFLHSDKEEIECIHHDTDVAADSEEINEPKSIRKNPEKSSSISNDSIIHEYLDEKTGCWYQCWGSVVRFHDKKPIRIEVAMDITKQKQTEHRIRQFGNLRERLFSSGPLCVKLQDIADTAVDMFALSVSCTWLFTDIIELSHQQESSNICIPSSFSLKSPVFQHVLGLSGNSENHLLVESLTCFSGIPDTGNNSDLFHSLKRYLDEIGLTFFHHHSDLLPLTDGNGKWIGFFCSFRKEEFSGEDEQLLKNLSHIITQVILSDLTMQAHIQTMEKYQVLVENLPQGVFLKDSDLRYISCNKRFAAETGLEWNIIFGKRDEDIFPPQLADLSSKLDQYVINSRESKESTLEYVLNGKTRWIESIRTPLIDNQGTISGILGIMHDVTHKKLAEEELQCLYNELEVRVEARTEELLLTQEAYHQANRKLNLLNSITRHDILNQITALNGFLECGKDITHDEELLLYIKRAEQSAKMIEEQITFTKLYQDIGVHAPIWQPVRQVVNRVVKGMETMGIEFHIDIDTIAVYADPLLEKVFFTLIENSLRHGNRVTEIRFGDNYVDGSLILWYEDNGIGIEPENKKRIFQRGFGRNTGLGLFLVQEILAITGSAISETGVYGNGARFEITFPNDKHRTS